jgi:O-antigen ligase
MRSLVLLDGQGKAFTLKEKILYFLVTAFLISLFLPDMPVIVNILIGLIAIHSVFFYSTLREKWQLLRQRKEIGLMTLFYVLNIISALISINRKEGLDMIVLRLPLLAFPLIMGLLYIREALKDRLLLAYCISVTLGAIVCTVYSVYRYRQSGGDAAYLYDDSLSELVRRQSTYLALMVTLALFSYVYLLLKAVIRNRWLAYLSMAYLVVFHFMLASRVSIITLYSGFVVFVAYYSIREKKLFSGFALLVALFIAAFALVKIFPKTLNRFRELNYTEYTYSSHAVESHYNMQLTADQWNGANIRLAVWKCGWELAGQHWLTGVPLGDKQAKLMDVYKARQFDFGIATRRDMHNSYLDELCNFGVFGLGIFLLGYLVVPLMVSYRDRDRLRAFITLAFAAAMITESWLDTSFGCTLIGFFLGFLSSGREAPDGPLVKSSADRE